MAILVQHQPGIVEELSATSTEENSTAARRGDSPPMKPHEQRMFEDLHMMHRALEQHF